MHEEDLKGMKSFNEILEKDLRKEINRINDAGTVNPTDVKTVTDAICLMLKAKEYESWLEEDSYSSESYGMHTPYHPNNFGPARSTVTGRYVSRSTDPYYIDNRYMDGSYSRNSYDGRNGGSYGRTHYDMGYSGHSTKDRMIARLEDMMGEAKNDYEMNMIRNAISQIQSSN